MKKLVKYFHITLGLNKMTVDEETTFAYGIKTTGDPDVTNPSYTDTELQGLADKVRNDAALRATAPTKTLTALEQQHLDSLSRAIVSVKNDVETIANKKAQGNKAIFDQIVTRIGFGPKADYTRRPRAFEFLNSDSGCFHVRVPLAGKGSIIYYYRYGITSALNIMPAVWENPIALSVTEVIVSGFKSGTIVAVQYAALQSPRHTKKANSQNQPPATDSGSSQILSTPTLNDKGKVVITHQSSYLEWSEILYFIIPGTNTQS
jgi:hypothetical protein